MILHSLDEMEVEEIEVTESLPEKSQQRQSQKESVFPKNSLLVYIESLGHELKTSEKVTKNSVLKSVTWTKSCYDLLSKIITEDLTKNLTGETRMTMGTSLSSKTLQKIISANYKVKYPVDPRTLNTLNKVVMFLGYKNWEGFVEKIDNAKQKDKEEVDPETIVKLVVEEAVRREHFAYCSLPEIKEEYLIPSHLKNSPSYNMIMDVLVDKADKSQIISNTYNPSTYEILDIEVKKLEDDYAQVYTKEYWLLCWWDTIKKRYVKRYKDISDHFYILTKQKDRWIIKTNASISDPMELG